MGIPKKNQSNELQVLQDALDESNLIQKLKYFSATLNSNNYQKKHTEQSRDNLSNSMLAVKIAVDAFLEKAALAKKNEIAVLERLGLRSILSKRAWLNIFLDASDTQFNPYVFEDITDKLIFIRNHQQLSTRTSNIERQRPFETPAAPASHTGIKMRRETALVTLITFTLMVFLVLLTTAQWIQPYSQVLVRWSTSNVVFFRSIVVLLLVFLSVSMFQLITRISRPHANILGDKNRPSAFSTSPSRLLAGCIGPLLLGFGTGISASAGFGAFGVTVMLDGIYQTYGVPFWVSQLVISITCYYLAWKWAKIPLGLGTFPSLFLIGPAISFGATIASIDLTFIGNLVAFVGGTLVFAFGIAMTAAAALGPDAKTALSLAAERKNRWPISRSTFFFNMTSICIGITLGGNFGVATIVNLLAVPTLLHYLIPPMRRYFAQCMDPNSSGAMA